MQQFFCIIENGEIFRLEMGQKIKIGVSSEYALELEQGVDKAILRNEELSKKNEEYLKILKDNGLIADPADEMKQLQSTLSKLTQTLASVDERLKRLENELK